ncbi:GlsB/YeaQ/YmgE family stress response membrane protein [Rhizorhapis sp.]|uniref:GlsB/YeaQ/YmgE family stress response membrane protein n=1 Tax=Rhizorhapis sp. TaxID=1968842 RepID=UPI002B45F17A|nr:GlsB/YeaQ/YmgE family stress response membrane protein [Rhizorhapis sp.]HKR18051.1 GlsB/YeaQ/YmgE family stress response membrane protein [Rhizorhapis sp.]
MDILIWLGLGLVAGALAKFVVPGKDPGGCVVTILLGIAGALLAGFVGRVAGLYGPGERAGWIAATLGAAAILVVYNILRRR